MSLIFPAIYLKNGCCMNHIIGESGTEPFYNELSANPKEMCYFLRSEDAKSVYIIDLNTFWGDYETNREIIKETVSRLDVGVWLHGYYDSINNIADSFQSKISRLVIDNIMDFSEDETKEILTKFNPYKVTGLIRSDGYYLYDKNVKTETELFYYAYKMKQSGFRRIVFSLVQDESLNLSSVLENLRKITQETQIYITFFEGIGNSRELWLLDKYTSSKIDSLILGKALFENYFPCQKIWRMIECYE